MSENIMPTVSIAIGSMMYERFSDLPNTISHVFAEFIDNALQSYRDNNNQLVNLESDFELKVSIDIEWDAINGRAKKIVIIDNAAGIGESKYACPDS